MRGLMIAVTCFVMGLAVSSFANDSITTWFSADKGTNWSMRPNGTLFPLVSAGGISPSGLPQPLLVDQDGFVICSTHNPAWWDAMQKVYQSEKRP